jgi:hypothetical protein
MKWEHRSTHPKFTWKMSGDMMSYYELVLKLSGVQITLCHPLVKNGIPRDMYYDYDIL